MARDLRRMARIWQKDWKRMAKRLAEPSRRRAHNDSAYPLANLKKIQISGHLRCVQVGTSGNKSFSLALFSTRSHLVTRKDGGPERNRGARLRNKRPEKVLESW